MCTKTTKYPQKDVLLLQLNCFNCLNSGHTTKDCKSKLSCRTSKRRHNSLACFIKCSQLELNWICGDRSFRIPFHSWTPSYSNGAHCKLILNKQLVSCVAGQWVATHFCHRRHGPKIGIETSEAVNHNKPNWQCNQILLSWISHLRSVKLADPSFNRPGRIEIILGSDIFEEFVLDGKFTEENGYHFRNSFWFACIGKTS